MKNRFLLLLTLWWIVVSTAGCSLLPASRSAPTAAAAAAQRAASAPKSAQHNAEDLFLPASALEEPVPTATLPRSPAFDPDRLLPRFGAARMDQVLLYTSAANAVWMRAAGLDPAQAPKLWEGFLRKYKIPYRKLSVVSQLAQAPVGTLVLPSQVALDAQERDAILAYRQRGGSVFATWLAGTRSPDGKWLGLGFLRDTLGVTLLGDTRDDDTMFFLTLYGDSPVTHHLSAGARVWLPRTPGWYPLRLAGAPAAAHMMDWGRSFEAHTPGGPILYDEKRYESGHLSRSVVWGVPEAVWGGADARFLEAILHNGLLWTLRQPDAYLATWPYPYRSAFVVAIEGHDGVTDVDIDFARMLRKSGLRATYYLPSEELDAPEVVETMQSILADGFHEFAYYGDHLKGFARQTPEVQAERLEAMRDAVRKAGLPVEKDAGFRVPFESYDVHTSALLAQMGFGHQLAFMDVTDACVPKIAPTNLMGPKPAIPLVFLPRTLMGLEDWLLDNPDTGVDDFFTMLDRNDRMGGLSIVTLPTASMVPAEQLRLFFSTAQAMPPEVWRAQAGQVARWWTQREQTSVRIEPIVSAASRLQSSMLQLIVTVPEGATYSPAVYLHLPSPDVTARLSPVASSTPTPAIHTVDPWRVAVSLEGIPPGTHRWNLDFPLHREVFSIH
ncbi:polysaccharide deacetylase family protein [Candidatus Symbiobacter mobilis]|uniref:NodB homology domain-containing protein n=1 Tax=Candidatus Symbiobacter mobilis CR TaxID=946483 RepID=U5N4R5_9BURK|nr:polysaccharide deacetylase family protein [Candidatus Symbiobacter mobilis]AGX86481.1 hypothetical protein Cenrod_0358 [Candidatus Symbiobacter mobilis CR]